MHDFTYPRCLPLLGCGSSISRLLQTVGARIYPEWRAAFEGLPELMRRTGWVGQLPAALEKNGFVSIETEYLTVGTSAIVTATAGGSTGGVAREG